MTYMHLHKQSIYSDRNMQQTASSYRFGMDPMKQTKGTVFKQTMNSYLPSIGRVGFEANDPQHSMLTTYDRNFNAANLYSNQNSRNSLNHGNGPNFPQHIAKPVFIHKQDFSINTQSFQPRGRQDQSTNQQNISSFKDDSEEIQKPHTFRTMRHERNLSPQQFKLGVEQQYMQLHQQQQNRHHSNVQQGTGHASRFMATNMQQYRDTSKHSSGVVSA